MWWSLASATYAEKVDQGEVGLIHTIRGVATSCGSPSVKLGGPG